MQVFKARFISRSRGGRRAQVVVLIGKGSTRRSVSRHAHNERGVWVGRNPSDEGLARVDRAEKLLERREEELEKAFARQMKFLGKLEETDSPSEEDQKKLLSLSVRAERLRDRVEAAKTRAGKERGRFPLYVQYNF